jgi:uncharacterized membrane protein
MEENDPNKLAFPEDLEALLREDKPAESPAAPAEETAAEEAGPSTEAETEVPQVEARTYSRTAAREQAMKGEPARKGEGGAKAAICYLGGWITGLLIFMTEKDSAFIRFHAIQSLLWSVSALFIWLILGIIYAVVGISLAESSLRLISVLVGLLFAGWGIVNFLLYFYMMYKAFTGEWYKLPMLGDKAEELS